MRRRNLLVAGLSFLAVLADSTRGQISGPQTSAQIRKEFVLGQRLAEDLERKDGRFDDPVIVGYVQGIENRLAGAIGVDAAEVRISRSSDRYAWLMPHGVLYISFALLERVESEAELAGLLAHQLAHVRETFVPSQVQAIIPTLWPACALASQILPFRRGEGRREPEMEATKAAIQTLSVAGYEPYAVLDLLSKLAYEHPAWAKAIVPEDLLNLRAIVESNVEIDIPPQAGYMINSSEFIQQHARLVAATGHAAGKTPVPSLTSSPKR